VKRSLLRSWSAVHLAPWPIQRRLAVALILAVCVSMSVCSHAGAAGWPVIPWQSISVVEGWGPCPQWKVGQCSRSWTILRRSKVVKIAKDGGTRSATLSDADFKLLRLLTGNAEFQTHLANGFDCPPAPTDFTRALEVLHVDGSKSRVTITGCGEQTSAGKVHEILSHY